MIEEILPNIYRMEIPLPRSPLKAVNCYVIKSQEQSLIVDTGMHRVECLNAISSGLKQLGADLNKADFFITHMHSDHSGLVPNLAVDTSRVYITQADAATLNSATVSIWKKWFDFARMNGFPHDELKRATKSNPGYKYRPRGRWNFCTVEEGEMINAGDYSFECIETPGHTKGHTCLYEPNRKLFISGDHILSDITPVISSWFNAENPLDEYLVSLRKVYDLDVNLVLPGHRSTFQNFKARIQELEHHHQLRANEVLSILERGKQNAFQVASQMSWDMNYESWAQFPSSQKWFAAGEALAHLEYLKGRGEVQKEIRPSDVAFSLR